MKNFQQRRLFLKTAIASSTIGIAVSAGLLTPATVLANWPESAFTAKSVDEAVKGLLGGMAEASDKVVVDVTDVAENGAIVPVEIRTDLDNVENISILVSENATPLTASFNIQPEVEKAISIRVKVGKSSDIVGVVKANGKLYTAKKGVKVTQGGCG